MSEKEIQLSNVVLDVAQVVEHQFGNRDVEPFEPAALFTAFLIECSDGCAALLPTMCQIILELLFCVNLFGDDSRWVQLVERKRGRGNKHSKRIGQIEVKPEERVVGDIPELGLLGAVAPKLVGTREHGIAQHSDGSTKLLPQHLFPGIVHFENPSLLLKSLFAYDS